MPDLERIDRTLKSEPRDLGARLRLLREARGLTQEQVAVELGVARTTVVAFEQGQRRVRPAELVALARLVGVPVSDILQRDAPAPAFTAQLRGRLPGRLASGPVATSLLPSLDLFQQLAEDYVRLEALLGAPLRPRMAPRIEIDSRDPELLAEDAAATERSRMGLGDAPIGDFRGLLESELGLRVFQLGLPSGIAGLYAFTPELGGCIAVNLLQPIERRRLSLAHEYAHFLESREQARIAEEGRYSRRPSSERFAEAFSYAFLMPETGLRRRFLDLQRQRGGPPTLADAMRLANTYGVSAEATVRRLEALGLIPSGTWDRVHAEGFRVNAARGLLGLSAAPDDPEVLPPRYLALALEAWEQGELSEGQLMSILREDRIQVRRRIESWQGLQAEGPGRASLVAPLASR